MRAIESLRQIDYPRELVEVIVSEGLRPSCQRNRAASEASGQLLYFLDDDSMVEPDILKKATSHFSDSKVAAVGGPSLTPQSDSTLQQAFGIALASCFGGGAVCNRYRRKGVARTTGGHELILCNLGFRRSAFLDAGGLDERLYPNEENELIDRLIMRDWLLIHDPDLAISRSQRENFAEFVRQLFTYGRGRAEQTLISRSISVASLLPSLFLIYMLFIPICANSLIILPFLCYMGIITANSFWEVSRRRSWKLLPLLLLVLPALHLSYGAGMIWGGFSPRFKRIGETSSEVVLRRVELWCNSDDDF